MIGTIADTLGRGIETMSDGVSEMLFEPVIRLGVTGLARSGKTVFIPSLVANLMDRGRMAGSRRRFCNRSPTTPCRGSISKAIWPR